MFRFIIQNQGSGAKNEFSAPLFPPELKQHFQEFCELAKILNESSFVKNWPDQRIQLHFGIDGKVTNIGTLPTDDEIATFLHRLRPIYLTNEPLNFNKTANLLSRHFQMIPLIVDLIRRFKQEYDGRDSQEVYTIRAAGEIINSEKFFDDYANALEYHRDPDRKKQIDTIEQSFPLSAMKSQFVLLLAMRMHAINGLTSLFQGCLAREDGSPISLLLP